MLCIGHVEGITGALQETKPCTQTLTAVKGRTSMFGGKLLKLYGKVKIFCLPGDEKLPLQQIQDQVLYRLNLKLPPLFNDVFHSLPKIHSSVQNA